MTKERFKLKSAVYLIPMKSGKVLLTRRFNTGWMDGKYSLISGHLDGGETCFKAAIREAEEEAGIVVNEKDLIPLTVMHRMSDGEYIDFVFVVEKWKGEPKIMERDKCDDMNWFPVDKLPSNTLSYLKKIIGNYRNLPPFFIFGWKK